MDTCKEVFMAPDCPPNRARERRKLDAGSEDLAQKVANLSALDASALREKWLALFGAEPSPRLGRSFMFRALAYRLQEKALGALSIAAERLLDRVAEGRSEDTPERVRKGRAGAGTVLIREWRGVTHRVTVLDHDVVYRGRRYKSLSEVARAITGTHWSGPLFFGLKRRSKEVADG
jgi:hypothetical protein